MTVADSEAGARPAAASGPGRGGELALLGLATVVGALIRWRLAGDAPYADELSTYWIVVTHGLPGVISTVHSNAEITPPLYFVLSWLSTQAGHSPELLRAPSLVAGVASIPLVYALGLRTVGRGAALLAAVFAALSPFMAYYSAEARAYGLMMALVLLSTLAMLHAIDSGRRRWWVVYAAASAGAMYSHYTAAFVLITQLLWLLWAHPARRRPALLANAAAAIGFLPWITGLVNDFTSPTSKILSALAPFNPDTVRVGLEHWAFGYPYAAVPLGDVPGRAAVVLLGLAVLGAAALALRRSGIPAWADVDRRVLLLVGLALATPVGEAAVSLVGTNLFGVRNLAASWPALGLCLAALIMAPAGRARLVPAALAVLAFGIAAARVVQPDNRRADFQAAADYVDHEARGRDVVIDETGVVSPGPLTVLDVTLRRPHTTIRAGAPRERAHPFTVFDRIDPGPRVIARAVAAARGGRVFIVEPVLDRTVGFQERQRRLIGGGLPAPYRAVRSREFSGFGRPRVTVFAPARR